METQYQIGDVIELPLCRSDANFDRACDAARHLANMVFGVDLQGHITNVQGAERSCCSIDIEFIKYWCSGRCHNYTFEGKVTYHAESEDDG